MLSRTALVSALALSSLFVAHNATAQPRWGRDRLPNAGARFYEDANYHGRSFCVPRGATYTSLPSGFNDRISSIRVFGSEVRIFQDRNFGGRSKEVRKDAKDLKGEWRDTVSSIRVF